MAATAFQAWLDAGEDYETGRAVYAQRGSNTTLKKLLELGPTAYNRKRLRLALAELIEEAPAVAPATSLVFTKPAAPASKYPPEVQLLVEEKLACFKEAAHLQAQLRVLATDAQRLAAAKQIKALMRRNQQLWDDINHFDEHGHLPPAVPIAQLPQEPADMLQRVKTLATYISSKRGTEEKRAAWRAEKLELERRLADG